jgi:transcriptional regulator with GAF, ATPase, and Fis domain
VQILSNGSELRAPIGELTNGRVPIRGSRTLAEADRAHIVSALCEADWMIGGPNGAAARLGLNRTTLIAKMRKLGILRETAFAGLA